MSDELLEAVEVGRSEVALAADIMLAMVKTSKGVKMYQENSPLLVRFFQELCEKMFSMLNQYNLYKLDVERFELKYKGHQVYENSDPKDSMAFRMYSDGIRSIIFREGLEEWELRDFLEIVNMSASYSVDDDIVTRLWDKGLPHFSYILEEDFHEIDRQIDEQLAGSFSRGSIPTSCLNDPLSFMAEIQTVPEQLFTLSADEMTALQRLLDAEDQSRSLDETGRILSAILSGAPDEKLFSQFLGIYMKFLRELFVSGQSELALKMFAFLCRRGDEKELHEDRKRAIQLALGNLWTEDALKGLCRIIDTTEVISPDGLKTLSIMIGRTAPSALCELLGLAEKMKMRKVLISRITDIAREKPQLLIPYLKDSRWYLVRNIVLILSQLQCARLLDQVVPLITHRELRVRKEVLKYLLTVSEPRAKPYILKFLRDEKSAMRIMAVQFLGRARLQLALKPLIDFVASDAFELMDISEKKAVYVAIAELGGVKVLPLFKVMLTRKFHFQRAKEREAVICAAAGLQKIPDEESLQLLKEALKLKTQEHHEVISAAIEILAHTKSAQA